MDKMLDEKIMHAFEECGLSIKDFENKRFFITGATGLIGKNLVYCIAKQWGEMENRPYFILYVRNQSKALHLFQDIIRNYKRVKIYSGSIMESINVDENVDYIIHAASETASKKFIENPVEVAMTNIIGTKNVLDFAKNKNVEKLVYLSTMEVYGEPEDEEKIGETHGTNVEPIKPRSSYPESKRMGENLCCSYCSEYGVPVNVIRLAQTFGQGVNDSDKRVFAEFARCAKETKNIVLRTKGETKRSYLSVTDAVTAILTVASRGIPGEAYNAANEKTYSSIYEMAKLVADKIAGGKIEVVIQEENVSKYGYAGKMFMNLDSSKLRGIGWKPSEDLEDMYRNMINLFD